jgi:hypothetical protein
MLEMRDRSLAIAITRAVIDPRLLGEVGDLICGDLNMS